MHFAFYTPVIAVNYLCLLHLGIGTEANGWISPHMDLMDPRVP